MRRLNQETPQLNVSQTCYGNKEDFPKQMSVNPLMIAPGDVHSGLGEAELTIVL